VVILTQTILPNFEDQGEEAAFHPSDGAILLRVVRAPILIVRVLEDLPCLLEADPSLRVPPQGLALGLY